MSRALVRAAMLALAAGCGSEPARSADSARPGGADSIAAATDYFAGDLVIEDVVAPRPVPVAGTPPVAVYFTVRNTGSVADTLDAVEVTAGTATLHQQTGTDGSMEAMVPLTFAVIPPGESIPFHPGGRHVMIEGLARPLGVGEVIPMTMVFRRAGRTPVGARVIEYRDLEGVLAPAGDHGH